MKNSVKFGMVSADKIMLSSNGIRLLDVYSTIEEELSPAELALFTKAFNKLNQGEKLNCKELKVLDRIDQDGLVDHMKLSLGLTDNSGEKEATFDQIMECLEANMCSDCIDRVHQASFKIANQIPLTEDDVWIMQEASSLLFEELGFSFNDSEIGNALIEACDHLGIKYNRHSEMNSDSPIRPHAYRYN